MARAKALSLHNQVFHPNGNIIRQHSFPQVFSFQQPHQRHHGCPMIEIAPQGNPTRVPVEGKPMPGLVSGQTAQEVFEVTSQTGVLAVEKKMKKDREFFRWESIELMPARRCIFSNADKDSSFIQYRPRSRNPKPDLNGGDALVKPYQLWHTGAWQYIKSTFSPLTGQILR